ncbi:helix-turn-helix domain-containing protein [Chitinophagaceae bacterium LB-8]|uniref:Helix-turn-helix domain-containing protein n=1 Tax=Paraflavisolibacter caeni TaxID=2982496 RepID=A0A9X3B7V4_9BACT|nr:helix-turn-helix domain-containing protein [Paraflavisolibacter caeni]MCU7549755.1 helix-turn-helix domain-containing protein [Paraflavisolibacter caeni]
MNKHHFGDADWQPLQTGISQFFHINRIEDYIEHIKFPLPPHRKTVYDFIFLTQGHSVRTKGLDKYEIEAPSFFYLPPYQITTHEIMSRDAKGFYCHFDAEILTKYYKPNDLVKEFPFLQFIGNPIINVEQQVIHPITNLLSRLKGEYDLHAQQFDVIGIYLLALFVEVKRFMGPATKLLENASFRVTQQYKEALMQFVYQKQKVSLYADLLAVTPNHLNKCVKAVTGKSAHDLLDEMILLEAKALLKQTSLSISEIADKVGKEYLSDFVRFFKTKTSLTPTEYRQLN